MLLLPLLLRMVKAVILLLLLLLLQIALLLLLPLLLQDKSTAAVFGDRSYNEVVELLFLALGDEEMEALAGGSLRALSLTSHHSGQVGPCNVITVRQM
jgi:hypothetical protein